LNRQIFVSGTSNAKATSRTPFHFDGITVQGNPGSMAKVHGLSVTTCSEVDYQRVQEISEQQLVARSTIGLSGSLDLKGKIDQLH